jgi:hypothetical protein
MNRSRLATLVSLVFVAATVAATTVAAGERSSAPGASPCAGCCPATREPLVLRGGGKT